MHELDKTGLRKVVVSAIFDPGVTEGYKGDRTLTEWQTDAVMRALASSTSAGVTEEQTGTFAGGLKAAVKFVRKRLDDYVAEHGMYDPETGATEFPGNGDETVCEWEEIIEGLEALKEIKP